MTHPPVSSPYRYESICQTRPWVVWVKRILLWLRLARFASRWRGRANWSKYAGGWNTLPTAVDTHQRRLNLGCGHANYFGYINLDIAPTPYTHVRGAGQALPFVANSFDEVLCTDVIEHLSAADGEQLLEEVFRVLRQGGHLILVTPDLDHIVFAYTCRFATHAQTLQHLLGDARDHRYLYTASLLTRCVCATGFTVQRCIPHWGPIWAHTVVLAGKP